MPLVFQRCDSAHVVGQAILAAAGFQPAHS
jgi:hypothetical protein